MLKLAGTGKMTAIICPFIFINIINTRVSRQGSPKIDDDDDDGGDDDDDDALPPYKMSRIDSSDDVNKLYNPVLCN